MNLKRTNVAALLLAALHSGVAQGQPPPGVTPVTPLAGEPGVVSPRVVLEIGQGEESWGRVVLELDVERAPRTVDSFLHHVDAGFYDGTVFHRVLPGFLVQGGGYATALQPKREGVGPPVPNEAQRGLKNRRGTIAMARGRDPHSATTQFFINLADNAKLDYPGHDGWGYCVFGRVVQGMDVVDRIARVSTRHDPRQRDATPSRPVEPPVIRRAWRLREPAAATPTPRTAAPAEAEAPPTDTGDEDRAVPESPEPPSGESPDGTEERPSEHELPR